MYTPAVQQNGHALQHVSAELRADREVHVVLWLRCSRMDLCLCTPLCGAAGGPYEVVLAAVQHDGDALQLPSADLQEDRAIVLAAVQRHGDALYYALTTPLQR